MIIGTNITKAFTADPILEDVEFKIGANRKIGLVGRNGCGKTTLFRLIIGEIQPDSGNLQVQEGKIGYLPQELNFPDESMGEYLEKKLENEWDMYKIDILAGHMKFANYDPKQPIKTLSEGQKMKLKMMETMLSDPTILFIDEPTNHLDIEGIMWFENYIKNLDITVVMISHDREFLNNTVDEIWEIENKKILRFVGNYDYYKEEKLRLIGKWDEEYVRFVKHKKKLEDLLKSARSMKGGKRGAAVRAAKTRIRRETEENKKEKYETKKMKAIAFDSEVSASKLMVSFKGVTKKYGKITVFENLDFEVRGGRKVWLFGPNGFGKTTIVKMIVGEEKPTAGEIRIGDNVKVGYFAQKQTHLNYDKNLLNYFVEETECDIGKAYGFLKKFLFERDDLKKRIKDLSPGQRARFAFAIFAFNDYDLLVLDEPTNHLDIETKEVIEESLHEFQGTLLLVSHDRFFVERVGITDMLNLKEGRIFRY